MYKNVENINASYVIIFLLLKLRVYIYRSEVWNLYQYDKLLNLEYHRKIWTDQCFLC